MSTSSPASASASAAPADAKAQRRRSLTWVAGAVVVLGVAYGAYHHFVGAHFENTDNAYVQGNLIQITPQVGGTVLAVNADDTDFVKAGQPLVRLDPADAQVAVEQAEAQLAQTVREVRGLYANNQTLAAQIALRQADVVRMQSDVARAEDDVRRRQPLLASGAVGKEEYSHATAQLAVAKSALAAARSAESAAREQLAANRVLTDGTTVEDHPNVQRAAARVREAYLALRRVELPAPVDGYVAKRSVQLGQRVQAGAPMMSVVPLSDLWVDANFKEGQLRNLRIGQPATLTADVYGGRVEYHGTVVGLGAGTGSAFALLPAQNATGNWIKVVQRVPVRIALQPQELAAHPLRVGLSMDVTVDVADQSGKTLSEAGRSAQPMQTTVFDQAGPEADAAVRRIIASNAGHAAAPTRAERPQAGAMVPARTGALAMRPGAVPEGAPVPARTRAPAPRSGAVPPAATEDDGGLALAGAPASATPAGTPLH